MTKTSSLASVKTQLSFLDDTAPSGLSPVPLKAWKMGCISHLIIILDVCPQVLTSGIILLLPNLRTPGNLSSWHNQLSSSYFLSARGHLALLSQGEQSTPGRR